MIERQIDVIRTRADGQRQIAIATLKADCEHVFLIGVPPCSGQIWIECVPSQFQDFFREMDRIRSIRKGHTQSGLGNYSLDTGAGEEL